jgi:integrase
MSVRKRTWKTRAGEPREAWIFDYVDGEGDRHIETFARKKDADDRAAVVKVAVNHGTHTAASKSITVEQAAKNWLAAVEGEKRERSTLDQYRQHVRLHIVPSKIGRDKLSSLTTQKIDAFKDNVLATLSRPLARKVMTSLKSLLKDAQRRGNVAQNVATNVTIKVNKREKRKLKVGVHIPEPSEIKRILDAATGTRWRPLLMTLAFTGLRSSELRGLRWEDVDLKGSRLHVRQRADRYNVIGNPKSEDSHRAIPIGPMVVNALREWKLACPKSEQGIVFPTGSGGIFRHENLIRQGLIPMQIAAGMLAKDGEAKYTGLHALRHFYASWCINRRADGGLELPPKEVQERLGHASIVITLDTYGHLFPKKDDGSELAEAERALLA